MNSASRRTLGAFGVLGLSLGMVPAATAADMVTAEQDTTKTASQGETGEYIVLLDQPAKVAAAGGLDSTAGKKAAQAHTTKAVQAYKAQGIKVTSTYETLGGFTAKLTPAQAEQLKADPTIAAVGKNGQKKLLEQQDSPQSWGLDRIDQTDLPLDDTFTYQATGEGTTAYVIDSGINREHQDFTGRVGEGFTPQDDGQGTTDCGGHGTHVAGTVTGTESGVAKGAKIEPLKVFYCDGSGGWDEDILGSMDWVLQNASGPSVINMSLGGPSVPEVDALYDTSIGRLKDAGIVTVVAAGNDAEDACNHSPANSPEAITVGATNEDDSFADYSNYGSCVDVLAPGSGIVSADAFTNDGFVPMDGTSMAAPHVAGAVSLFLEKNPDATVEEVTEAITSTATQDKITGNLNGSPNLLLNTTELLGGEEPDPDRSLTRLSGADRYATAARLTEGAQIDTVYLASGEDYPDALTGSTAAASGVKSASGNTQSMPEDLPILLTRQDSLPKVTREALQNTGAKKVVVVGGKNAVSAGVEAELKAMGITVERIGGEDRYETSANVAKSFGTGIDTLYVASGEDRAYADALAGSALAGSQDVPVLLTDPNNPSATTIEAAQAVGAKKVVVLGGKNAVSEAAAQKLGATERVSGADRYATSVAIASQFGDHETTYFATGEDYPDSLTGGAVAAAWDSPLLLTRQASLPGTVAEYVKNNPTDHNTIFGGTAAVSTNVENQLKTILGIN
ncbi:cell wall-binding repeat-containing protein [Kytococcus sp. Marseille-QA3725]